MITDAFTILSGAISSAGVLSGQTIGAVASAVSTNSIDTGPRAIGSNQAIDLGNGNDISVNFVVTVVPTLLTSVEFQLIQADDGALTTNVEVIRSSGAITLANLPLRAIIELSLAGANVNSRRFVGARYLIAGTNTNAGTYWCGVVADQQDVRNTLYRGGFVVA